MNLARELVKYPQACLRADRSSALYAVYASESIEKSLQYESERAIQVITKVREIAFNPSNGAELINLLVSFKESIEGAKKFVSGLGKQGKFNVNPSVEPQEWQKEFEEMKKRDKEEKAKAKGKDKKDSDDDD